MGEAKPNREEYTFTTISGQSVPTKVISYYGKYKVTEDIEYDSIANPITKTRHTEVV